MAGRAATVAVRTDVEIDAASALERAVAKAQKLSGAPMVFGGPVHEDQRSMAITTLRGNKTTSLSHVQVRVGEGLGGKCLALAQPTFVRSYSRARGITRRYVHAVAPESLESILAVPVVGPGRAPIAVLYLADRSEAAWGDRAMGLLRPVLTELAHDLRVAAEVGRRTEALRAEMREARAQIDPAIGADLLAMMESTTDEATRAGLSELLGRLGSARASEARTVDDSPLTRRETQALLLAEQGASNREIAVQMGISEQTVKSYMKDSLAKLGAENRIKAARLARDHGFLG